MIASIGYARSIVSNRLLVEAMVRRQFRTKFAATIGGLAWSFVAPLATMLVYWFVFSVGLRVQPVGNLPFIVVFAAAFVPWLTFSESVVTGSTAITENPHLVKKCVFPVEILPFVSVVVSLVTHAFLLLILFVILLVNGVRPTASLLQLPYYLLALVALSTGLSWFAAALNVLLRDTREMLGVVMNLWFWVTPIVWPLEMVPARFAWLFRLNPVLYVAEGYRDSLLGGDPFWTKPLEAAGFWCMTFAVLGIGAFVFRRVRTEFAEVL